jgi:hypothetical protein
MRRIFDCLREEFSGLSNRKPEVLLRSRENRQRPLLDGGDRARIGESLAQGEKLCTGSRFHRHQRSDGEPSWGKSLEIQTGD